MTTLKNAPSPPPASSFISGLPASSFCQGLQREQSALGPAVASSCTSAVLPPQASSGLSHFPTLWQTLPSTHGGLSPPHGSLSPAHRGPLPPRAASPLMVASLHMAASPSPPTPPLNLPRFRPQPSGIWPTDPPQPHPGVLKITPGNASSSLPANPLLVSLGSQRTPEVGESVLVPWTSQQKPGCHGGERPWHLPALRGLPALARPFSSFPDLAEGSGMQMCVRQDSF